MLDNFCGVINTLSGYFLVLVNENYRQTMSFCINIYENCLLRISHQNQNALNTYYNGIIYGFMFLKSGKLEKVRIYKYIAGRCGI